MRIRHHWIDVLIEAIETKTKSYKAKKKKNTQNQEKKKTTTKEQTEDKRNQKKKEKKKMKENVAANRLPCTSLFQTPFNCLLIIYWKTF